MKHQSLSLPFPLQTNFFRFLVADFHPSRGFIAKGITTVEEKKSAMCIAVFIWQSHPLYPFILLSNRDEYHMRPTKPAEWWEGEDIFGGRDEVAFGTWLACSRSGRFAFLTNVRERENLPDAMSRGDLPVRFLKSKKDPLEYAMEVMENANSYNGFNLILADFYSKKMVYVTNRPKDDTNAIMQVSPGIHVLTNSSLDCSWPKARRLSLNFKELLGTYLNADEVDAREMVEKLMTDTVKAEESELPGILPNDIEYQTSSIFVDAMTSQGRYGTRSISAVTVKDNGEVSFYERYLDQNCWKEHTVRYNIQKENCDE